MAAIPVSGIFGNPLSGWIMDAFNGAHGLRGWQWMFVIEAVPAVLVGIAVFLYLDNRASEAKWLTDAEKAVIERDIAADNVGKEESPHSIATVFRNGRVWFMSLIYFCFVTGQYGLTFWMPTLVKATGRPGQPQHRADQRDPVPVRGVRDDPARPQRRPDARAPLAPDRARAAAAPSASSSRPPPAAP